ncbi:alternative ribosome rescue aminoacyl-tRNA hydrolase ArfB [Microbacterium sp. NPDC055683]
MDDLLVPPGPGAPRGIRIPTDELVELFSRSSGPGGQGVNTADSRVQLRFDIAASAAFDDVQRARLLTRLAGRLVDGVLTIAASEERSQLRNRRMARERLADILREAVVADIDRRRTKPTRGSTRRRLEAKQRRGAVKQTRRRPSAE